MKCCEDSGPALSGDLTILLAGQPNAGKTSVFNALTGASQRVGNWPGVTVERKEGQCRFGPPGTVVIDIPGTYSLESASLDEAVARDAIAAFPGALIVNVLDATMLERQLMLSLELLALGRPMVIALTMSDELERDGRSIDRDALAERLGHPVLAIDGRTGKGAAELVVAALSEARAGSGTAGLGSGIAVPDPMVDPMPDPMARSAEAKKIAESVVQETCATDSPPKGKRRIAAAIDGLVLNPVAGPLVFLAVVFAMFEATFGLGGLVVDLFQGGLDWLGSLARAIPLPIAASFVEGALVQGVGNVLLLVPYVFFMFLFLSFLEDSGYMARAVYATDALMRKIGLNGKAFIPLIMGFGCNVPAIMAIRTIESPRDRLRTTLMVPFTSCSARLPVYVVIAGAFFGKWAALVIFGLYLAGMLAGIFTAALSSKFIPPEKGSGLIMEIPPYRMPLPRNLLLATWNRTKGYLAKAGTVILAASGILWLLSYLPLGSGPDSSLIALIGKFVAPVFKPLGFDWRLTVGLLSGVAAKEVVISTLALLAGPGASLEAALPAIMGPATALAFLVFVLLYTPCLATLAVMKSETGSRKWTAISLGWSLFLAYAVSFLVRLAAMGLGAAA
jgi:ferrous iron transport protein B